MSSERSDPMQDAPMADEYDFAVPGAVRGKHARTLRRGYRVVIHKHDGTTEERDFTLPSGVVALDPDVLAYFPDSESVNRALRGLIDLIPKQHAS